MTGAISMAFIIAVLVWTRHAYLNEPNVKQAKRDKAFRESWYYQHNPHGSCAPDV